MRAGVSPARPISQVPSPTPPACCRAQCALILSGRIALPMQAFPPTTQPPAPPAAAHTNPMSKSPHERLQLRRERLALCSRPDWYPFCVELAPAAAQLAVEQLAVRIDLERRVAPRSTHDLHTRTELSIQPALEPLVLRPEARCHRGSGCEPRTGVLDLDHHRLLHERWTIGCVLNRGHDRGLAIWRACDGGIVRGAIVD